MHEMRSRALGALYGLALGDALGMPTESLPRAEIVARYGPLVETFHPGPPDHPLAAGLPAGTVTDDTEQAVLLARLVVAGGGDVDAGALAAGLLAWEDSMRARGSLSLLGPSTKRALAALGGEPARTRQAGAGSPMERPCGWPRSASPPRTRLCWWTAWSRPAG
jgi:ADP-ribosylglycohydrolase